MWLIQDLIYCLWLLYTLLLARHKFYFILGVGWDNRCGTVVSNGPWFVWLKMEYCGTTVDKGRPKSWKTIHPVPKCPIWTPHDLPSHWTQTPLASTRQLPVWYTGQILVMYLFVKELTTFSFLWTTVVLWLFRSALWICVKSTVGLSS